MPLLISVNAITSKPGLKQLIVVSPTKENDMQTRTLGNSGLEVSALGFGRMGLSFGYGD
jgi:hypothetical protein